jgi:hypothetical protein
MNINFYKKGAASPTKESTLGNVKNFMKKKGPQNTQKTRKKDTKIKKNFCVFLCVRYYVGSLF